MVFFAKQELSFVSEPPLSSFGLSLPIQAFFQERTKAHWNLALFIPWIMKQELCHVQSFKYKFIETFVPNQETVKVLLWS